MLVGKLDLLHNNLSPIYCVNDSINTTYGPKQYQYVEGETSWKWVIFKFS